MSTIATKTGDGGTTSLLFGRRVSKTDLRIVANGRVDALNASLGVAKASQPREDAELRELIGRVQDSLVNLMGEVAVAPEDRARYAASRMAGLDEALIGLLDARVERLEADGNLFKGWAVPGANMAAATLDSARAACREAEIALVAVHEAGLLNPERAELILQSMNRLSDVLWLEARRQEGLAGE